MNFSRILRNEMSTIATQLVDFEKLDNFQETFEKQIYQIRKKQGSTDNVISNVLSKFGDINK